MDFKARYGQPLRSCTVQQAAAAAPFEATRHSSYPSVAGAGATLKGADRHSDRDVTSCTDGSGGSGISGQLLVRFQRPVRAITPGQVRLASAMASSRRFAAHQSV